jgi:hypothetical protein
MTTYIDTQLGVAKIIHAALNSDKGSSQSLGYIGTDIQHIPDELVDFLIFDLLFKDIVET